jgi:hypothetical protein
MTGQPPDERPLRIAALLGLGLDGDEDQLRITRGDNFCVYGGSRPTHRHIVDIALRFNDEVDRRGKTLGEINARELADIARDLNEGP